MSGFNGTGPSGQGSMTGRRMGACASSDYESEARFGGGRRFGRGFNNQRGMGMGFRHGNQNRNFKNMPEVSDNTIIENEINSLKNQLSALENKLSKTKEV
ncbi:MAG: hypothetical protein GQ525_13195 [Draconibacterium sp.]|nr:hypothetical protein [Draconibacterium sp.]